MNEVLYIADRVKGDDIVFYDHLVKLLKELNVEGASAIPRELSSLSLDFDGTAIVITDVPPGLEFSATIGEVPEEGRGDLPQAVARKLFGTGDQKGLSWFG